MLSGTGKTGSSVVKGRASSSSDPGFLAALPSCLPKCKLHRMIPQAPACNVRRRERCCVGVCSFDQDIDAVVLPASTPGRPTEIGWKRIGLPSFMPRDEVVIDSCGADGISLQRLCDIDVSCIADAPMHQVCMHVTLPHGSFPSA